MCLGECDVRVCVIYVCACGYVKECKGRDLKRTIHELSLSQHEQGIRIYTHIYRSMSISDESLHTSNHFTNKITYNIIFRCNWQ